MHIYLERLARLKKEISLIASRSKKRSLNVIKKL